MAVGLTFTPLYLLKSHFGPPVAASILCLTQTYTQTRFLVRALAHLTHAQSVSLHTQGESTEAYHDSAGSGAGDPAQKKNVLSFISRLLRPLSSRFFYLGITIIKSSGSRVEFESLYFFPNVIFHPSCHSNRNHSFFFGLGRFSTLLCLYFLYLPSNMQSLSHLETRDDELC